LEDDTRRYAYLFNGFSDSQYTVVLQTGGHKRGYERHHYRGASEQGGETRMRAFLFPRYLTIIEDSSSPKTTPPKLHKEEEEEEDEEKH
jgi:hypothetical protein